MRFVAQERDPGVAAHVALLGEATHSVDPHVPAIEVAPYDRRLRVPARRDRAERGYWRALGQVAVGRRDLIRRVIAEQADGSHHLSPPGGGAWRVRRLVASVWLDL